MRRKLWHIISVVLVVLFVFSTLTLLGEEEEKTKTVRYKGLKTEWSYTEEEEKKEEDATKLYKLDGTVVTATRHPTMLEKTPEIVRVVSSEEIEALNVSFTGDILEYITGVNVETGTGSGLPKRSIVSMDGFPANYTLVLVDGVKLLTEHIHTGQNVEMVPPENIERIEVLKGAASAQYGNDAMGGIVNIITKDCYGDPKTSFSSAYGSYGTFSTDMLLQTPINERIKASTFAKWEKSNGQPILEPAHRLGNMGYKKFSLMNSVNFDLPGNSKLDASVHYVSNSMEFRGDNVYGRSVMPSFKFKTQLTSDLELTSNLNYSHWESEQSGEKNQQLHPELFLSWDRLKNNRLAFGGDFKYMNFVRSAVLEEDQQAFGGFIQDEFTLNKFSLFAALRYDKVEDIKGVVSPKLALLYSPLNFLRVRGSVGRGFHAPTVQELYEEGYGHGGTAYRFGNPDLEPEYSMTSTFSTEFTLQDRFQVYLYGYYSTIDNMITPIYEGPWEEDSTKDKWVRTNIHEAKIYGYEVTARWHFLNAFTLEGGYTFTDNENTSTGNQLPYYPGKSYFTKFIIDRDILKNLNTNAFVSLRAAMDRSAWNWKPASDAEYDNADGLITELEDYELLSAGVKVTLMGRYDVFFNVNNLLGQDIEKLDDAYTVIDGEPVFEGGFGLSF